MKTKHRLICLVLLVFLPLAWAMKPPQENSSPIVVSGAWEESWREDADKGVFVEVASSRLLLDGKEVTERELVQKAKLALSTKPKKDADILMIVSPDVTYRRVAVLAQTLSGLGAAHIVICYK